VRLWAISLGLISLLTGAAQGRRRRSTPRGRCRRGAQFAKAQKAYEALLPELRSSDPAALGAALIALSKIASAQGQYDSAAARAREAITSIVRPETDAARRTQSISSASQSSTRRITRPHSISWRQRSS